MRVPLVVLTGFLGSGKTTLLNRMLARRAAAGGDGGASRARLGVIVNELGAVDIDGALIGTGASRQINLPGGCVCCVMGDDLDRTLIELVDDNPGLEAIVLETTGVAEPLPIAWAVARAPVCERVRLAAVVTLVDALAFRASRGVSGAVDAQVAYADVVLVTKAELAGPAATAVVVSEIRTLASRALVREGTTDEHAAWLEQLLIDPVDVGGERVAEPHVHDDTCDHDHGIETTWVPVHDVVDLEELEDQLAELPNSYVRIKGIVRAIDGRVGQREPRWMAVHRVGLRVSSEPIAPVAGDGRIVALGSAVDTATLAAHVSRAIVEAP